MGLGNFTAIDLVNGTAISEGEVNWGAASGFIAMLACCGISCGSIAAIVCCAYVKLKHELRKCKAEDTESRIQTAADLERSRGLSVTPTAQEVKEKGIFCCCDNRSNNVPVAKAVV